MKALIQWIHILSAVVAVGGTIFMRFVLVPVLGPADADLRKRIIGKFRPLLYAAILLLLATGIYNAVGAFHLRAHDAAYQAVLGMKMLLALVLFAVAAHLVIPTAQPNFFQRNPKLWLTVNAVIGIVILAMSAWLRRSW